MILLLACVPEPAEARLGERLFLEPRFAQYFAARYTDVNLPLAEGDPTVAVLVRPEGALVGPFAGSTMSCRQCHLVDDVVEPVADGVRTYADFAPTTPIPERGDGLTTTPRNTPSLVDASLTRDDLLLHFDGEFATGAALVRGTFTGRNLGWLPDEADEALAHLATVIREDDGSFPLAPGRSYRELFAGEVPEADQIPEDLRIDVDAASDDEVADAVGAVVAAYMDQLLFSRGLETGEHDGSPYDTFLAVNGLPRAPSEGEAPLDYARRLRASLDSLESPEWVDDVDGRFSLHSGTFAFGEAELRGLRTFLDGGNCVACHAPPEFTDFGLHDTGVSQAGYDRVWGEGAFAALEIPSLEARALEPARWLPPSAGRTDGTGIYRALPDPERPGAADLGAWNIFGDDLHPEPQAALAAHIDAAASLTAPTDGQRLDAAIALFKTPSLRDLPQSAPFLHDGSAADLDAVIVHYREVSDAQRAGTLRNGDPRLADVVLTDADVADLRAFLLALSEDYD